MIPEDQLRQASVIGLLSAAIASLGIFAISRTHADTGGDARAIRKAYLTLPDKGRVSLTIGCTAGRQF